MAATCTLTIASQNAGVNAGQRISATAAETFTSEKADVLCMQEGRPLRSGEFIDNDSMMALNSGFTLLDDGPYLTRVRPDRSLAAMSLELPLYAAADLMKPGLAAKYGKRTFQQITVRKGGHTILILNVHCRCGSAMDTAPEFRKIALRGVKAHAEHAVAHGPAHAAVVCGDLNLSDVDTDAIFSWSPWTVHHVMGGTRNTGQPFYDVLAFFSNARSIRCNRVSSTLGCGANQVSDVHGAGKLVLTVELPVVLWTRYWADKEGTTHWWAKGTPGTDEMLEYLFEESAAVQGWTLSRHSGEEVWTKDGEFFFAATGYPFLL